VARRVAFGGPAVGPPRHPLVVYFFLLLLVDQLERMGGIEVVQDARGNAPADCRVTSGPSPALRGGYDSGQGDEDTTHVPSRLHFPVRGQATVTMHSCFATYQGARC